MSQIAGLQDFRQEGPPADIGTFLIPAGVMVFAHRGLFCAVRSGERGWVLVDYDADYATVVNAAIADVAAYGGNIVHLCACPAGVANFQVTIPIVDGGNDNIILEGEGKNTLLYLADNSNCHMIHFTGNYAVVRDLHLDGNQTNNTAVAPGLFGIAIEGSDGLVTGCYVEDVADLGITGFWATSDRLTISHNIANDCGRDGIAIDHASDCAIIGNYCSGNKDYGIGVALGASNITICGNRTYDNKMGIYISDVDYFSIIGNICHNENSSGINIMGGSTYGTISGNQIHDSFSNLELGACSYITVSGNSCTGGRDGMMLNGASYCTVCNNNFTNTSRDGIMLWGTTTHGLFVGNSCISNDAYGIVLNATSDYNHFMGNLTTGNTSGCVNIANANCNNNVFTCNSFDEGDITNVGTNTRAWLNYDPSANAFITTINPPATTVSDAHSHDLP